MSGIVHMLIAQYGLLAVFFGCVAEGESVAIMGGLLAHQGLFVPWQTFCVAFAGAFAGDAALFILGKRFSGHPFTISLMKRPGFRHAREIVAKYPAAFVLLNRYVYGLRVAGGIAAGLSGMSTAKFLALNALASLVWAGIFVTIGYSFGLAFEQLLGREFLEHRRLLIILAVAVVLIAIGIAMAHVMRRRYARSN